MKKILFAFAFILGASLTALNTTNACDPFGCLLGGNRNDAIFIGVVESVQDKTATVKPYYVFPQSRTKLDTNKTINVQACSEGQVQCDKFEARKPFFLGVNKTLTGYKSAFGIRALTTVDFKTTKLVTNKGFEHELLNAFIRYGGTETDFYGNEDGDFLRKKDGTLVKLADKEEIVVNQQSKTATKTELSQKTTPKQSLWQKIMDFFKNLF